MIEDKFDVKGMASATVAAELSYCKRRKVGAVITVEGRTISDGYNGTHTGENNSCEDRVIVCPKCKENHIMKTSDPGVGEYSFKCSKCEANCDYDNVEEYFKLVTSNDTVHAEQNAIVFASKRGISLYGSTLYVTTAPCKTCSVLIAGTGISRVVYRDVYRDTDGVEYLKRVGVKVHKYSVVEDELHPLADTTELQIATGSNEFDNVPFLSWKNYQIPSGGVDSRGKINGRLRVHTLDGITAWFPIVIEK